MKIGQEHMAAMIRQGLNELRNAFYPDSNISRNVELGVFGTKTSGEIPAERRDDPEYDHEDGRSIMEEKLQNAIDKLRGMNPTVDRSKEMDRG